MEKGERMRVWAAAFLLAWGVLAMAIRPDAGAARGADAPFLTGELIFPLGYLHTHASCVVECPNGDLLACWYEGSGERTADDVRILGARLRRGSRAWSAPFEMADTPGFPDCNPCMIIDPQQRLWLFWPVIQANEWHTALLMSKRSSRYQRREGPPLWDREKVVHLKPGPEFASTVAAAVEADLRALQSRTSVEEPLRARMIAYLEQRRARAADKYFSRLGWMPRAHPVILDGKRMILPLYSDGFDFSLMAITDDWGETWQVSKPLVGDGPVQPTIARRRDGTLVAYFRDNGQPPKRLLTSESRDGGFTWTPPRDTDLPNPGAGVEVINLRDGRWLLIYNDTERGRHSLAVSISDDEGRTWKWTRHLEFNPPGPDALTFAYPSVIQARDGTIHATYSYSVPPHRAARDAHGRPLREAIRHVHFNLAWVEQGDR